MRYRYKAYSLAQGVVEGRLEAKSEAEVCAQLELQGYKLLRLVPGRRLPSREELFPTLFHVRSSEIIQFAWDLSTILQSGTTLARALDVLQTKCRTRAMHKTVESVRAAVEEGQSFSEALSGHPTVFSPLFVDVVRVGEATGRLSTVLEQLADILSKEHEMKQKAIRTMMYPMAIMALSLVTLTLLMTLALPALLTVFEQMDAELPLMTRIAIIVSRAAIDYAVYVLMTFVALAALIAYLNRIPRARYKIQMFQLRLPMLGSFKITGELARISRTTAMLLEAGVSLVGALDLTIAGCRNLPIREAFQGAKDSLMAGGGFSAELRRHPIVPVMFSELLMIGEESNTLPRVMKEVATAYQRQREQRLSALLGILEPASTLVVGGIVAFIAFSMFAPIYSGLNNLGG